MKVKSEGIDLFWSVKNLVLGHTFKIHIIEEKRNVIFYKKAWKVNNILFKPLWQLEHN